MSQTQHIDKISAAIEAMRTKEFFSAYPENPKAYAEDANELGLKTFQTYLNTNFNELANTENCNWIGEEVSPYLMVGLGIKYPVFTADTYIERANKCRNNWVLSSVEQRATILVEALDAIANRFFEIAYATMHTTGQSFVMSFQASGPHANDRSLEVIALAYEELTRFVNQVEWVKPMGKFDLKINKTYQAIGKGVGLVIGCSTFPTWNTVPGLFANLMAGNPTIVKPHAKSVLPIAIVVAEIQKILVKHGFTGNEVQLACDTVNEPITKAFTESKHIQLIDYTGGNTFGDYIETLTNKTIFTEKAGVNSILLESVADIKAVANNIAFSTCLYSGQMCTAPQNIFISETGINTPNGNLSYAETVNEICQAITSIVDNPKMGPFTLGAIQNDATLNRVKDNLKGKIALTGKILIHPEFEHARMFSPSVIEVNAADASSWKHECFGPIIFIVKTTNAQQSMDLASQSAQELGAITNLLYSTDTAYQNQVKLAMNMAFTPVSINFTGAAFVNQHAAFSDFHVTGGNPSGNASFTNPEYVNKRWIWVGNRSID